MSPHQRFDLYIKKEQKKIKVKEIADYLGVSSAHVSSWFNNRSNMAPEKVEKMKEYIENKVYLKNFQFPVK